MKNAVKVASLATALAYSINPVSAQEVRKVVFGNVPEEVVVIAPNSKPDSENPDFGFRVGLSQMFLVHKYDQKTDSWKYVKPTKTHTDKK